MPDFLSFATAWPLLEAATAGLLYESEAEEVMEVVRLPEEIGRPTADDIRRLTGKDSSLPIEVTTLDRFFGWRIDDKPWHDERDRIGVARFRTLRELFAERLHDAQVFRIGAVRVQVVVVGRCTDGPWIGLKTHSVET